MTYFNTPETYQSYIIAALDTLVSSAERQYFCCAAQVLEGLCLEILIVVASVEAAELKNI